MSRVFILIGIVGILSLGIAATDVSLSGTVKDESGAAIAGATVSLVNYPSIDTTTDASGAFTLKGTITNVIAPFSISIQSSMIAGIRGKYLQFSIATDGKYGKISIFSANGRLVSMIPLVNVKAGTQRVALPSIAPGSYFVSITMENNIVARKLIVTASEEMYLSDINLKTADRCVSIQSIAADGAVDTILVKKSGFKNAKVAIDSYTKSGIQIVLSKEASANCVLPNLPEPSGLTKENPKLPDPFTFFDGTKLTKKSQWACRRKEIIAMACKYLYGKMPPDPDEITGKVSSNSITATVKVGSKSQNLSWSTSGSGDILCIKIGNSGMNAPSGARTLNLNHNASPISSLYGYSDITATISCAWQANIICKVIEMNPDGGINPDKIMVTGCSGAGKVAFTTGAFCEGIDLTVIVESGGGGAASLRMAEWFRHGSGSSIWKCADKPPQGIDNLEDNGLAGPWVAQAANWVRSSPAKVKLLPFDQHCVLACIAPRAVCHFTNQNGQNEWCHLGGTCEALSAWA
ncbi:MAG: carboxypeptidase regulatory-like domain-containing protein, partial [Chitinispirillaceae bacterium]|nr:carboxypeptidase regulatory-like domain-containing protein [Chitinispirillaceae bacterium]